MKRANGVDIPVSLEELIDPKGCALILYDMQVGIIGQIEEGADLGFVPIVVRDACGAGHKEAADRASSTLAFLGDTLITDFATVRQLVDVTGRKKD